jgi:hypothetical protein
MVIKKRWKFHDAALKFSCTEAAVLNRLKANPVDETDLTVIDADFKITPPIEMLNDEKERHTYGTVSSILLAWCRKPAGAPKEKDRLISGGIDYRVRKVKAWPNVAEPAFYELHLEDES